MAKRKQPSRRPQAKHKKNRSPSRASPASPFNKRERLDRKNPSAATDRILPKYFIAVWNSPTMRERIEKLAKTSGIWKVNQGHVASLTLPLPPLAEQKRIVAKVDELMASVDQLEQQLAHSRTLGQQLLAAVVAELTRAP